LDPIDPGNPDFPGYTVLALESGDDLETRALNALITAEPNTVIQLPAGTYDFVGELSSSVDNIVLRGTGMDAEAGTVLRFDSQTTGAQSLLATGNNFVVQDLAIENSPGDAIKIIGTNGVTIQRVRVEWTNGPDVGNGAYGLYPVQTRNVLIEDCEVRGASDAGVYVGQSENIIVRRNYVYENVAGIEIENSKFADVYENNTVGNTAGILVFDLPGPPIQGGEATRVFDNTITANNEPNFAPEGNVVGQVPAGVGLMIMANDDIEAFGNTITDNYSIGVLIVSYYFVDAKVDSPDNYDPVPEKIYIHDNTMNNNSSDPQDLAAVIAAAYFPDQGINIFYDSSGIGTDSGLLLKEFPDGLTESRAICIIDNGPENDFGRLNGSVILYPLSDYSDDQSSDITEYNCRHAPLTPIVLEAPIDPSNPNASAVDSAALCNADGTGVNVEAFVADCPNLSDYRLFADPKNPLASPNGNGVIYDLNTPLFSDYANKYRFVFVPGGSAAAYRNQEVFDFPVGTIIVKTFTFQADLRIADSRQDIIETRLLIRRKDGWAALPYTWDPSETDALLTVTGGTQSVNWVDINGEAQSTDYSIPNSNNCANCHGEDELLPIGPKARSLNKNYAYENGSDNQLTHWTNLGILAGVPSDLSTISTIPLWNDTSASLDDRARGYLDVNCGSCHSRAAGAANTSGLWLEYDRPFGREVGECKPPIAAGDGSGGLKYGIVPGNADASILHFRMTSNAPEIRMPESGRSVMHSEGVQLIADWINAMEPNDCETL
jgi:parallel beta-helix repeat protein